MYQHGFSFEQWVVTPNDGVVSGPYGASKLEPRVMAVLVDLAAHAPEVVSRYELIDRVWRGAIVGDEVLSRCIYQARRALGESSRNPHFIETVPKHGYRLNATVSDLADLSGTAAGKWREGSPFQGLQSFDVEHAPVFFGRTRATREALAALLQQATLGKPFLLLLGASGVGKSSLARAGILHNLVHRTANGETHNWCQSIFRPGDNPQGPIFALADAIDGGLQSSGSKTRLIGDALRNYSTAGDHAITDAIEKSIGPTERLAIVVDQMEEVFGASRVDDDQRHAFFNALETIATEGRCWIVATMRSEFYPNCVGYPALMRLKKGGGQYDVGPMRPGEILQSIQLPALASGLQYEKDPETGQGLDEILYEAAVDEPKALPLLQFTLQALYDERSADGKLTCIAYEALGGIQGSLARRAETVFDQLPGAQQDMLPQVAARLVRNVDGHDSAASSLISDFPSDDAKALINAFVDARLFSSELGAQRQPRISVTHEALLTSWPRIRNWLDRNREMIHIRGRVEAALERWVSDGQRADLLLPRGKSLEEARLLLDAPGIELNSQERKFIISSHRRAMKRRFWERAAVATLGVLAIVAAGLGWQANMQREIAIEQSAIADREALAATETAEFLIDIFEAADPSESTAGQLTAKRILDHGVERLDEGLVGQTALRTRIRALVARAYKGIGLYNDAESLLRQALNEASGLADFSERERLAIRFELANVLFEHGRLDESEALHAEVRAARLDQFGENDIDTMSSMAVLAHELWRNGDISAAANLFKKILSIRRDLLGDSHRQVSELLSTLGTLYYMQGVRDEAEVYYREAADQARSIYGNRHVSTAIALSNLAIVESDPEVRELLLLESLSIRQDAFGTNHHLVARAEEILANFYAEQGQTERADSLFRQAVAKLENADERTPVLPRVQNKYARFLQSQQRFTEALDVFAAAHRNFAEMVGIGHRWTLTVRTNQAYLLYIMSDIEAAENMLREAIAIAESVESVSPVVVADIKKQLAEIELDNGEMDEAIKLAEYSTSIYREDPDVHRVSLATSLGILARARLALGEPDLALASADRALALSSDDTPLAMADYLSISGLAQVALGDCASGLPLLDSAKTAISELLAPDRRKTGIERRISQGRSLCGDSSE